MKDLFDEIRENVMDLQNDLMRIQEALEKAEEAPERYFVGQTEYFRSKCGAPLDYGDRYCRECGRKISWR
ncbi:MAG: hypothetical protein IKU34_12340 [Clostridia bacterium]|nr:hypothetical protein [Clostridia bacterium]